MFLERRSINKKKNLSINLSRFQDMVHGQLTLNKILTISMSCIRDKLNDMLVILRVLNTGRIQSSYSGFLNMSIFNLYDGM